MTEKELINKTIYFLSEYLSGKTLLIFTNGRNWEPMYRVPPFFIGLVKDNCVKIAIIEANNETTLQAE